MSDPVPPPPTAPSPGTPQQTAAQVTAQANATGATDSLGNVVSGTQNVPATPPTSQTPCPKGHSGMDVDKAVKHLDDNALPKSKHRCAHYVADAMQAGGLKFTRQGKAQDYGPTLEGAGFEPVSSENYTPQTGDVVVIQGYPATGKVKANPNGHIAMWDGSSWVSDFDQGTNVYPGSSYETAQPSYQYYRP